MYYVTVTVDGCFLQLMKLETEMSRLKRSEEEGCEQIETLKVFTVFDL